MSNKKKLREERRKKKLQLLASSNIPEAVSGTGIMSIPTSDVGGCAEACKPPAPLAGISNTEKPPEIPLILREDGTPYSVGNDKVLYNEPIAVGYVHMGMVHEIFMRSLAQMIRADSNVKVMMHESSCNLPLNRNLVLHRFLDSPKEHGDWLLFLDTDIGFPLYSASLMLKVAKENDADMVAVPYQLTNGCSTFAAKIPGGGYHTQGTFQWDRAYAIDAAGTGCMLLKRTMLEKMRDVYKAEYEPWEFCGYDRITINGKPMYESEDYSLSRRMQQAGGKLVGYTGIVLSHMKTTPLVFQGMEGMATR